MDPVAILMVVPLGMLVALVRACMLDSNPTPMPAPVRRRHTARDLMRANNRRA